MCLDYRGGDYHDIKQKSIKFVVYCLFVVVSFTRPTFEAYNFILLISVVAQRVSCNKANLHKLPLNIHYPRIYRAFYFSLYLTTL